MDRNKKIAIIGHFGGNENILDGQTITFPYTLTIAGADGVDTGTVYLREMVDGEYVERGHYSNVPFKQS